MLIRQRRSAQLSNLRSHAELYRGKILKLLLATCLAVAAYVVVGLLRLDKIIKLNRHLLQFGAAMGSFAVALVVLLKVI